MKIQGIELPNVITHDDGDMRHHNRARFVLRYKGGSYDITGKPVKPYSRGFGSAVRWDAGYRLIGNSGKYALRADGRTAKRACENLKLKLEEKGK